MNVTKQQALDALEQQRYGTIRMSSFGVLKAYVMQSGELIEAIGDDMVAKLLPIKAATMPAERQVMLAWGIVFDAMKEIHPHWLAQTRGEGENVAYLITQWMKEAQKTIARQDEEIRNLRIQLHVHRTRCDDHFENGAQCTLPKYHEGKHEF